MLTTSQVNLLAEFSDDIQSMLTEIEELRAANEELEDEAGDFQKQLQDMETDRDEWKWKYESLG
jgi:FtsZ-binding cell division protein ZapB